MLYVILTSSSAKNSSVTTKRQQKQIGISNVNCIEQYNGTIMKTASLGRLRQIIAHAAVGASADACNKNMT